MDRRCAALAGLLAPACALALAAASCREADQTRPDILLIVIDTLRADHVGIYGHSRPTTPQIDALAREGVWYRRAYAHSSWTLPSFASLLTGLLPHEHRVGRDPSDAHRFGRLPVDVPTLAERLGQAGYQPGAIVNNTFLAPEFGLGRGFGPHYDYRGASNSKLRSAEESVDAALAWTHERDAPFFLLLHLMEPHLLYDPPPSVRGSFTGAGPAPVEVPFGRVDLIARIAKHELMLDRRQLDYVRALYDEEILYVDRALGRLFEELRQRPRWPQTVVIVTADHGEEFFDHGGFEHGHSLYGELTRVPLVIHGAGIRGGEVDAVAQHVDLFRTILELAGAAVPEHSKGIDLLSPAGGEASKAAPGSVSEDVLYGPPRASFLDGEYRIHVRLDDHSSEVWRLDEDGLESTPVERPELSEQAQRLAGALQAIRGDLLPREPAPGPRLTNPELFDQLESLGYIDAD